MIDSLFIIGEDKQIIIEKHWKSIIERSVLEPFYVSLKSCVSSSDVPPVLENGDYVLFVVKEDNIFFIAVSKNEVSPMLAIEFIKRIISLFRAYINNVSEMKIRSNFSLIYQLLDEVADFGVPVITEPSIMSSLIAVPTTLNKMSSFMNKVVGFADEDTWLPGSNNSTISWRRPDVKYARNEIRFYIVERLNATVTPKGKIVDVSANGTVRVQSRLSGNPEIAAMLTGVDNVQGIFLHKIVNRSRFNASKTLEFVPLDGVFDVMNYNVTAVKDFAPAFYCRPSLAWAKGESGYWGQLEVMLGARPRGKKQVEGNPLIASNIVVTITLPAETTGANITASVGHVRFSLEEKTLNWVVGDLRREDVPSLKGPVFLQAEASAPKSSMVARLAFVQTEACISGLSIGKITAQRVAGDYGLVSNVQSQVEAGYYDIQM